MNNELTIPVVRAGETATIFANEYLNKLSDEKIWRECQRQLDAGCKKLCVNFQDMTMVNSIGVSILLGIIDAAQKFKAKIVFCNVNDNTFALFKTLGITNHVEIAETCG